MSVLVATNIFLVSSFSALSKPVAVTMAASNVTFWVYAFRLASAASDKSINLPPCAPNLFLLILTPFGFIIINNDKIFVSKFR